MSGLDVRIEGSAGLKRLAAQIRATGDKGLGRQMADGLKRASQPVETSIRTEFAKLPSKGGYSGVFSKSLRFRTTLRSETRSASFRLLTFADGTHERRDIKAIEGGRLRHPVFGRSGRIKKGVRAGTIFPKPWAVTTVKGGYHQRGTNNAADEAEREMSKVLDEFASRLIE
jgi:hypothetical protein